MGPAEVAQPLVIPGRNMNGGKSSYSKLSAEQ